MGEARYRANCMLGPREAERAEFLVSRSLTVFRLRLVHRVRDSSNCRFSPLAQIKDKIKLNVF